MLRKQKQTKARNLSIMLAWLGTSMAFLLVLLCGNEAIAHSWYPRACCGAQDCRRVDKIDFLPGGEMIMHVGWMRVVVPPDFLRQPSHDSHAHVCISFATGTLRPICVFMPGTS